MKRQSIPTGNGVKVSGNRRYQKIDFNMGNVEVFARAQTEVMGEEHSYPMIAYGTNKKSSAWKLYAKAQGIPFDVANAVSEQIHRYEEALKRAGEDGKDEIDIMDYIEPQFRSVWDGAQSYIGMVTSWSIAPCGYLLYQGNIRKEIGLVRIKDNICCLMDGHWAEENHFLKNDLLTVKVVDLIYKSYEEAKIKLPTVNELLKLCPPEDSCWDIYKKGATVGINQVEQIGTSSRVQVYAPHNISELTAFVAAIRPGFKSMYKTFEERKPFSYGVKALDELIQTDEMPNSFILYQEQVMAALHYAGIPMTECYTAIKNIAKKRVEKVMALKETFVTGFKVAIQQDGASEAEAIDRATKIWQVIEDSSRYGFNACISADTVLMRPYSGQNLYHPTVGEMYKIKNDIEYARTNNHLSLHKKYQKGYGFALSLFDDKRIRQNKIVDIRYQGVRPVYRVTVESGEYIDCTMNHRFPIEDGTKKMLSELHKGDKLFVSSGYEKNSTVYSLTNGYSSNVPKKGQMGFQKRPNGASVVYKNVRKLHKTNRDCCELCKVAYSEDKRFELHHKDFNRHHNEPANYEWLCASCHKKRHYENGRISRYQKGYTSELSPIVSIELISEQEVYDVEMEAPAHTIISQSGLVASNSHAYCVALDSLYGAWLKAHYPLSFYKTYLEIQNNKGDKDKMNAAKIEAEEYFGILFPPFRFGQDNREIIANPETKTITNALSSIKGFSKTMSRLCWECGQKNYSSFIDVLAWFDARSVKTARLRPLIQIDYFEQFGTMPMLMNLCDMWDKLHQGDSKTLNRDNFDEKTIELFTPYLTLVNKKGQELKSLKVQDCKSCLYDYEDKLKQTNITDVSYKIKAQNQLEILGYVDLTTHNPEDRRKLLITDCTALKTKATGEIWAYRVGTKSIGTGKTARLTVKNATYVNEPINTGDFIYVIDLNKNKAGFWYLNKYKHLY